MAVVLSDNAACVFTSTLETMATSDLAVVAMETKIMLIPRQVSPLPPSPANNSQLGR